MKLQLIRQDGTMTEGETDFAHPNVLIGATYRYGGTDFMVVSAPRPGAPYVQALETVPMELTPGNFTV